MYKKLTVEYYKQILGFPEDYTVESFLSFGTLYNSEKQLEYLKKAFEVLEIEYSIVQLQGFLKDVFELTIGKKKYWFAIAYGGTALCEYVHLAILFGSKKVIHIGSCGGLNINVNSSEFIIPTFSHGDESSTRMYERDNKEGKHYSDGKLSENIFSKIKKEFVIHKGPIVTIQAMLAETFEDVQDWSKAGYFGVEMETAIMFAVANHFKVPSAALLYVSDNLIKGQIVGDEKHNSEKELREKAKEELYRVGAMELLNIQ